MFDQAEVRSPPIRVRARIDFFIALLLVAVSAGTRRGLADALVWAMVILVSLLVHELVRAFVGCAGGYGGLILLTGFGPYTRFEPEPTLAPFVFLRLGGPIASLVIGVALACARSFLSHPVPYWMTAGMSFN